MGVLSVLLWTPALGALLLIVVPTQYTALTRSIANLFALLALLICIGLAVGFNPQDSQLQFSEYYPINPTLGSAYALGIDGLSIPLLLLATVLSAVAMFSALSMTSRVKGFYVSLLLVEFGLLGVFMAQDWAMFFMFWQIMLIPLFFLIGRWGGFKRLAASLNFVLYSVGGSIFMLMGLLAISRYGFEHNGSLMTTLDQVAKDMPLYQQVLVLLGFLLGFGMTMALFPLHGWLPLAHLEAPTAVSVLLSGILLQASAYGFIRVIVMLPEAAQAVQPILLILALFAMLYGSLLAWRQSDLKSMLAYSSVSYMGMVLLAISTLNEMGIQGAVLQMTAHGIITGSLFLLVGFLYQRTQTHNLQHYGNLTQLMPRYALLMVLVLLAAMGLPAFIGFIAQFYILLGGFKQWGWLMIIYCLSGLINAAYPLRVLSVLFTGTARPAQRRLVDLNSRETLTASLLVSLMVLLGTYPAPLIGLSSATVSHLNDIIHNRIREVAQKEHHAQ